MNARCQLDTVLLLVVRQTLEKTKIYVFFQLPKVESALKKWLDLVRQEGLNVDPREGNRHNVVCSKHFVDGCPTFEHLLPTFKIFKI